MKRRKSVAKSPSPSACDRSLQHIFTQQVSLQVPQTYTATSTNIDTSDQMTEPSMNSERYVKLFRNGRNQAVQIPKEFEFEGDEAILKKEGDRLILEPIRNEGLLATVRALGPLAGSFPDIDNHGTTLDGPQVDT